MRRAKFLSVLFLVAVFSFSTAAVAQEKLEKLRFVHLEFSGTQAAPFIAKYAKLFEKNGLDVEIIRIGGSSRVVQAMLAGEVKMAHVGAPTVVEANLSGADLVVIASTVNVPTFHMMASPSIKTIQDLKGKKIGISRFGGATESLTRFILQKWGLDSFKDATLIQTGGVQETATALMSNAVDAGLLSSPSHLKVKEAGYHSLIYLAEAGIPYMSGSIATTRAFRNSQRDTVRRFTRALVEAVKIYKTDREFSMRALEQFTRSKEPKLLAALWEEFGNKAVEKVPYPSVEGLQFVIDEVAAKKPEAKKMKPADFIDISFIKELEESGFIKTLYENK